MSADLRQVLQRGWWLLALGLLTGLTAASGAGLPLGSTGADLVVTGAAGILAGNAEGVVAAAVGMSGASIRPPDVSGAYRSRPVADRWDPPVATVLVRAHERGLSELTGAGVVGRGSVVDHL